MPNLKLGMQGGPGGPLLVRRKGAALPAELDLGGALSPRVDWCASTLLNLVIQTSYRLTVAACRRAPMRCCECFIMSLLACTCHCIT